MADAVFALDTGGVGGPIATRAGAVIFQVDERTKGDSAELATRRDELREQVTNQRLDNLLLSIVEERRLKLEVHYNQQLLESVRRAAAGAGDAASRCPTARSAYDRRVIGFLRGRVLQSSPDHVLLDVAGVGYSVHIPVSTYSAIERARAGEPIELFIRTHVREDALDLYGFATEAEKRVFEALIGGLGHRSASGAGDPLGDGLGGPARRARRPATWCV